jgi:general secretion pathway protein K
MKIPLANHRSGIALVIVMIVITMFSIMVGGFAYTMKVETKLARNSVFDAEMDWMGRSGVELARYVLGQQRNIPNQPYDALNQKWAGAELTNGLLSDITLQGLPLGNGTISVKIVDAERRFNVNVADETILEQSLMLMGLDAAETPSIISSIQDWRDRDEQVRNNGAESDYYQSLMPPYNAKNGPLDDLEELLRIKGVTPEMYYGPRYTGPPTIPRPGKFRVGFNAMEPDQPMFSVGLSEIFCVFSSRLINVNTASANVLQLIPNLDENMAAAIITYRAGLDGVEGNDDDTPFRSIGEVMRVPGIDPMVARTMVNYCSTQSTTFEVEVDVQVDNRHRTYLAIVRRLDQKNLPMLRFYWKPGGGSESGGSRAMRIAE